MHHNLRDVTILMEEMVYEVDNLGKKKDVHKLHVYVTSYYKLNNLLPCWMASDQVIVYVRGLTFVLRQRVVKQYCPGRVVYVFTLFMLIKSNGWKAE